MGSVVVDAAVADAPGGGPIVPDSATFSQIDGTKEI